MRFGRSKSSAFPSEAVSKPELQLALQLINHGATETYDPTAFKDEERERVPVAIDAKIAGGKVVAAEHPEDTAVGGGQVVDLSGGGVGVRETTGVPEATTGQLLLDFEVQVDSGTVVLVADRANVAERPDEDWFRLGEALEESSPQKAEEAYRNALAADPERVDVLVNLGALAHCDLRCPSAPRPVGGDSACSWSSYPASIGRLEQPRLALRSCPRRNCFGMIGR